MRVLRGRSMQAAVLAAAIVVSAIAASSASAVLVKLDNGQVVSYQPLRSAASRLHRAALRPNTFDKVFGNMDYNGGPVMPSNTDYMVLWSPKGLSAYPPEYVPGVARFFKDLAHDSGGHQNVDSVSTQYNDVTGAFAKYAVTFGGAVVDTHPYPKSLCPVHGAVIECLTDAQIQRELERFVSANHLKRDLSHEYFLLTPPHVETCFSDNPNSVPPFGGCSAGEEPSTLALFCAYHGNTVISPMLFYSNDPFVTGNPGCDDGNHPNGPSDGVIEGGLSHEHNESITDPIPNDAWTNGTGPNHGSEIGDQCNTAMGEPLGTHNGAKFNQVINGHFYWYQEEWSNEGHACLQRFTLGAPEPTAQFSATAGSGLAMTFDATGSTAAGGIAAFSWQFNDAFGAETREQRAPVITHTFPESGSYSTGLAVFGPDGLSIGTGGIVTTGQNGFTPGFTFSPATPASGQTVSFSALTVVSRKPVRNYLWEFGDGTTGSGPTPTHTYEKTGTYTVKAVLFSGIGSAFPGDGAGPVVTREVTVS
jgi:PKD repeat protein